MLLLASCRSKPEIRGDFVQFFISEVQTRGGRTLPVESLPTIQARWDVERDDYGFQIHLFDVEFAAVDAFMKQVLGEPEISVPVNLDGYPQRMYDSDVSGLHIQTVGKGSEIYIVAVGPKKELHNQARYRTGFPPRRFRAGLFSVHS